MLSGFKKSFLVCILSAVTLLPVFVFDGARAQEWNPSFRPNFLLSDSELSNFNTFTPDTLKRFLTSRPGTLARFTATDVDGTRTSAADILWRVSQTYRINPRFLLVLMQKEQSLVDDPSPTQYQYDWATGYARCDGCSVDDPAAARFKGFAQQLESAAAQMRYFLDHPDESIVKKGGAPYIVDGLSVVPATNATAALYAYTPHLNGNYNLWKIWQTWFLLPFPDGSLVSAKDSEQIWLIRDGERHLFTTKLAFVTRFDERNIVYVDAGELAAYPIGAPIEYPNFTLVKNPVGEIYLITDEEMHLIDSAAFRALGFDPEEVVPATGADLAFYRFGDPISAGTAYPLGTLLQNKATGVVFYVMGGEKHGIIDKQLLALNFKDKQIARVLPKVLDGYPTGNLVQLKDGLLIKTTDSPTIFFISNGTRRPIMDEATFNALGWQMKNVITVSARVAALQSLGDPIQVNPNLINLASLSNL